MKSEFKEEERRYLLKKVKADIQNGATSLTKLTMLYEIEKKLTIKSPSPNGRENLKRYEQE